MQSESEQLILRLPLATDRVYLLSLVTKQDCKLLPHSFHPC